MRTGRVLLAVILLGGACAAGLMLAGGARTSAWVSSLQETVGLSRGSVSGGADDARDPSQVRVGTPGLGDLARRFYERRDDRPAWLDAGRPSASARAMIAAVRRAPDEGLDAADYDLASLDRRLSEAATTPLNGNQQAVLDGAMTSVFVAYASDVARGRVDPRAIHADWHLPPNDLDVASLLADAVEADRVPQLLAELPPPHPEYVALRQALAALRAEGQASSAPQPAGRRASSRPQASDRRAPSVPPAAERIRRVVLSMERWRWVPRKLGDPCIVINLPAFALDVREGSRSVLHMKIVAGKEFSPTPVFSDAITSILFHPSWHIPDGIARDEILPAALRDRDYMSREGIHALDGYGEKAREVDLASYHEPAPGAKLPFVLLQDPGPENPLGRIKFVMPNTYDIYLHDTPAGHLFAKQERALSHGCIRLEKPADLAAYLLRGSEWDQAKIEDAIASDETLEVKLEHSVPVHILYMTAWVEQPGGLHIGDDVYDLDPALEAMLSRTREGRSAPPQAPPAQAPVAQARPVQPPAPQAPPAPKDAPR